VGSSSTHAKRSRIASCLVWINPGESSRFAGARRAVLYGGILIAAGHFSMAVPALAMFYLGLTLIVLGTGLLKPNISTMVGQLYGPADARRDAGFSIFYMGINSGGLFGPIVAGYLAQRVDWHAGFACAGFGMAFGLVQYWVGRGRLKHGLDRLSRDRSTRKQEVAANAATNAAAAIKTAATLHRKALHCKATQPQSPAEGTCACRVSPQPRAVPV
jgi:amino acid/peptide:H+ symporter